MYFAIISFILFMEYSFGANFFKSVYTKEKVK